MTKRKRARRKVAPAGSLVVTPLDAEPFPLGPFKEVMDAMRAEIDGVAELRKLVADSPVLPGGLDTRIAIGAFGLLLRSVGGSLPGSETLLMEGVSHMMAEIGGDILRDHDGLSKPAKKKAEKRGRFPRTMTTLELAQAQGMKVPIASKSSPCVMVAKKTKRKPAKDSPRQKRLAKSKGKPRKRAGKKS